MLHRASTTDDRQRVRDASDIVAVVGDVVRLKPKGREYVGLCPFHDDSSPSMYVVPTKQIFHCFACGAGGDVFTFVQRYHGLEFVEALKLLAERAGIELAQRRPRAEAAGPGRTGLLEANQIAQAFFRTILTHPEHGLSARGVIERRGIAPEMVEAFGLGASPDLWDGLLQFAQKKGVDLGALTSVGLLKQRDAGGLYDALRHRLVFPIHQPQTGKVVGFGGRRINDDDEPKYLNSPESELFDKSRNLYGLHQAARSIQKRGVAVVVEGYTDVIACHQAGHTNVVGTLGTALTPGHAGLLRRLCSTIVLLFDGDEAGQRAADRAFEVLFAEPVDLKIAALNTMTDAKDPDELLRREGGPALFERVIEAAPELMDWHFARLGASLAGAGPAARSGAIQDELDRMTTLGLTRLPPLRKRMMVQQIARAAGVDERTIYAAIPGGRPRRSAEEPTAPGSAAAKLSARELALGCLLADGSLWVTLPGEHRDLLGAHAYGCPMTTLVADAVHRLGADGTEPGLWAVLGELSDDAEHTDNPAGALDAAARATGLSQAASAMSEGSRQRLGELLAQCVRRIEIDEALAGGGGEAPEWAAGDTPAAQAPGGGPEDPVARLERLRGVHQKYGNNPRARLARGGPAG